MWGRGRVAACRRWAFACSLCVFGATALHPCRPCLPVSIANNTEQGLYRLWDDKWKPSKFATISLGLSQVIIFAFGVASAFVFDSPGTVAAILCS